MELAKTEALIDNSWTHISFTRETAGDYIELLTSVLVYERDNFVCQPRFPVDTWVQHMSVVRARCVPQSYGVIDVRLFGELY